MRAPDILLMTPLFSPGDQKVFRASGEPRHRHLVNLVYLVLLLGVAVLGILALLIGQLAAGVLLILIGFGASAFILKHEISEALMSRRMRKRQKKE